MTFITVVITHVDLENRTCTVRDKSLGTFDVMFGASTPFRIPQVDELWTIFRQGTLWKLHAVVDQSQAFKEAVADAVEGDSIISTPGGIRLLGSSMSVNGGSVGYEYSDSFVSNAGQTYVLTAIPASVVSIWYGVDRLHPSTDFSVSGRTVTLTDDYAAGMPILCTYETTARIHADSGMVRLYLSASGNIVES